MEPPLAAWSIATRCAWARQSSPFNPLAGFRPGQTHRDTHEVLSDRGPACPVVRDSLVALTGQSGQSDWALSFSLKQILHSKLACLDYPLNVSYAGSKVEETLRIAASDGDL